jgi:hypothetical protein
MNPQDAAAFIALVVVGGFFSRPLISALARRLGGDAHAKIDPQVLEELREELSQTRAELGQLSERMDFTERVLAKQKDAERLPPPR